jgi:Uma2 family endonuclease
MMREPPLEPGDNLDQKAFHRRYLAMPDQFKAELIEGVVYLPSRVTAARGEIRGEVLFWLTHYRSRTPCVRALGNTTTILGAFSEPQPAASLLIGAGHGGRTHVDADGYLVGPPELVAEVALSSASIELHGKRRDYERAGVQEYLILVASEQRAVWFVRREGRFEILEPETDGIYRSPLFGGLWLDAAALLRCDTARVQEVLNRGLASPEHEKFLRRWPGADTPLTRTSLGPSNP